MAPKAAQNKGELLTLQEMFRVVGDQLTARDVRVLRFMFSGIFTSEFLNQIHDGVSFLQALEKVDRIDESNFRNLENYLRIINRRDLYQFLTLRKRTPIKADPVTEYLEATATQRSTSSSPTKLCPKCDAQNQTSKRSIITHKKSGSSCLEHSLTPTESNLLSSHKDIVPQDCSSMENAEPGPSTSSSPPSNKRQMETSEHHPGPSKRRCVVTDATSPAEANAGPDNLPAQCMERCARGGSCLKRRHSHSGLPLRQSERLKKRRSAGGQQSSDLNKAQHAITSPSDVKTNADIKDDVKKKITCDIRLRVRAEYCSHEGALQGNIHSNKPELIEQQFEKFMQANTILKSRDLGAIICDIKFSDLTYLDAFWRDYINGSLLEALKEVFITETLKQAVGHEAIKLMVNVDEDDYESGRLALLKNLQHQS